MTSAEPVQVLHLEGRDAVVPPYAGRWKLGSLEITLHREMTGPATEHFYAIYEAAFGPLRTRAAARQVLSAEEFIEEMADPRVSKYVAWDDSGAAVGMATITRHLESVPWISPEFYRARFPEHAARDAIFYFGFVARRADVTDNRVFGRLLQVMTKEVAAVGGVAAYDVCAFNVETLQFDRRIESTLNRLARGRFAELDTQTYLSVNFSDED